MAVITPDILMDFFHMAGIIIGLGAVTVVDTMGMLSRNSRKWTQITVDAHHVTKPLIWLGIGIIALTWVIKMHLGVFNTIAYWKTGLLALMVLNGCFLSFYVSPYLDSLRGTGKLVSDRMKMKITTSAVVSFLSWWSFVFITVVRL